MTDSVVPAGVVGVGVGVGVGSVVEIAEAVELIHTSVDAPAMVMNRSAALCGSFVVPVHVAPELIMMPTFVTFTAFEIVKEPIVP